jgi:hypothetical protein
MRQSISGKPYFARRMGAPGILRGEEKIDRPRNAKRENFG